MDKQRSPSNFFRFLFYVKPYAPFVALAGIGGIVKFTLPLFVPQITRHLIDEVFVNPAMAAPQKIRELLWSCGGMIALYIVVYMPFTYARHYFAGAAGHKSVFDLRCELYYRILRMSSSFFVRTQSGGIVSRLIGDTALAQNLVGNALTNIWIDGTAVFVILYFLIRIDPLMTAVALATFPLYLFFFRRLGTKIKANSHEVQQKIEVMSGSVQEKVAGSAIIRAFAGEKREENLFAEMSDRLLNTTMRSVRLQSVNMMLTGALTGIAPLIVTVAGGLRVISGDMSLGELVAVGMYLGPLYLPLQRFSELNVVFSNSMAAIDRIFEIIDMEPEIRDAPDARDVDGVRGDVAFAHVRFSYAPEKAVLNDIDFSVPAGSRVAFVGKSGSGKSTIVSLIPRFYDVDSGSVAIDGVDVRDIKLASLRRHIGMVLQDPILFSGTIRDNILYGRPKADERELIAAAAAANAYDFIADLPAGFDTEVGERGAMLSGGQKQRITIARAFLKDPRILILDEATSALDSESEILIQDALGRLMQGRTTFIIAHRLSTIADADRIMVLDRGRIVDSGTHGELLERSAMYRRLHDAQFRSVG
jgi:subfamily B ATP-binding cassette protein MsbA